MMLKEVEASARQTLPPSPPYTLSLLSLNQSNLQRSSRRKPLNLRSAMSEKFSPMLRLADLNDFIALLQSYIISFKDVKPRSEKDRDSGEKLKPVSKQSVEEEVEILDYLVCSGYITSAKIVMLKIQSLDEFLSHINSDKAFIVSLYPPIKSFFSYLLWPFSNPGVQEAHNIF